MAAHYFSVRHDYCTPRHPRNPTDGYTRPTGPHPIFHVGGSSPRTLPKPTATKPLKRDAQPASADVPGPNYSRAALPLMRPEPPPPDIGAARHLRSGHRHEGVTAGIESDFRSKG
ncbi:hypothetical protein [Pseudofrankia saprophytica]|uniref:hypothetical protein n=1 Tax=Pseudofrankia saprophytica TaxID=298655 RepID=UPI000234BD99|nr:hypothetical protein [Pseudofrankia saprophytica]